MNHVVLACEAAIGHLGLRRRAGSKKILSPESKSLQIWHFLKCSGWSIVVPNWSPSDSPSLGIFSADFPRCASLKSKQISN
jgi:hypothetical protein